MMIILRLSLKVNTCNLFTVGEQMSNVFAFATTELHFSLCCTVVVCQTLKRYFFTINSLFLDIDV